MINGKISLLFLLAFCSLLSAGTLAQEKHLENTSWQLKAIYGFNNSRFIPESPDDYLLRFRMDNRLQIEADCNQAGATWKLSGNSISLTDLVTTRKLCVAPSLFNRYIMNLNRTISFELLEKSLILKTNSDSDWMEFEPYIFTPSF